MYIYIYVYIYINIYIYIYKLKDTHPSHDVYMLSISPYMLYMFNRFISALRLG